ncbi:DUF5683 domain-containing protein [uncultured Hymenobacter sp.]|uniref:DUF5683 domain-containing protein n=1 Tax=uncultured Hymenobacter sp. TaxID=170016 RepID=UPI0035CC7449
MFRPLLLLLLVLLAAVASTQAQVVTAGPDSTQVNTTAPTKKQLSAADSAARTERLFGLRLTRPSKAALLAGLAPGAGQIYNKRWWKLPLVYGLLGGLGYAEYYYQTAFREYADASDLLAEGKTVIGDSLLGPRASKARSAATIQRGVVVYRRNRDLFILYLMGGYGLTILDALVDAHLRDFDVSDDLTLHWEPALLPVPGQPLPGVGLTASLSFK